MLTELSRPRVTTDEVYEPEPKKSKYNESLSPSVEDDSDDCSDDSDDSSDDEDPAREEVSSRDNNVNG